MRLIDAECDALKETIGRKAFKTRDDIQEWLDNAPTVDAVPVVRCKDCKYSHNEYETTGGEIFYLCKKGVNFEVPENAYCYMGERKER